MHGFLVDDHICIHGMDGRARGLGMGCQWLVGLVCRICLCAIWMGGAGEGGWGWVANG